MMTLAEQRAARPDARAVLSADGRSMTYATLDDRSMQLARRFRAHGLRPGDHVAVLLEDDPRYFEVVWAALRSGLHVTPVSWHLDVDDVGHVVEDCGASAIVTSAGLADLVRSLGARRLAATTLRLVVDGDLDGYERYEEAIASMPARPLDEELDGATMFYTSGTTGRPKGVLPSLPLVRHGSRPNPLAALLHATWGFGPDSVYLCALPLHHAAAVGFSTSVHRLGGAVVLADGFDPLRALDLIQRHGVTHAQFAPIQLVRLLELEARDRARFDLSSLRVVLHGGTSIPRAVKERALEWLGPIVHEYYTGVEGNGFTIIGPAEWPEHPGSVGRAPAGTVHVLDDDGNELPVGVTGQIWFANGADFEYHRAPERTDAAFNGRGWSTLGDVGHLDADRYLYLAGRVEHRIFVGDAVVDPQAVEDLLLVHPAIVDAAVVGMPDPVTGGRVVALVKVHQGVIVGQALADALLDTCRQALPAASVPSSIEFVADVGRLPTGKLHKRALIRS